MSDDEAHIRDLYEAMLAQTHGDHCRTGFLVGYWCRDDIETRVANLSLGPIGFDPDGMNAKPDLTGEFSLSGKS